MKNLKYYVLGILLVLLDQATKILFYEKNYDFGFAAITFTRNTGISFGLFQGSNNIIILVSLLFLGALWYFREEFKGKEWVLTVLVAGIAGNFLDRAFRGYVVDFINFKVWPVFNLADSYLTIAVATLLILTVKESIKEKKAKKKKREH